LLRKKTNDWIGRSAVLDSHRHIEFCGGLYLDSPERKMIFIATPIYSDQVHAAFFQGFVQTADILGRQGIRIEYGLQSGTFTAMNRENLVQRFLKTHCQFLLFIDSDMAFTAQDVCHLLASDKEVVSGIYRYRVPVPTSQKHKLTCVGKDGAPIDLSVDGEVLQECDVVPGGMLLIRRNVIEELYASGLPYIYDQGYSLKFDRPLPSREPGTVENDFVGEDLNFCMRWRDLGGKLWVNKLVQPGHVGAFTYTVEPLRDF
jgi:hypothetical protein